MGHANDESVVFRNILSLPSLTNVVDFEVIDAQFAILSFLPPIFLLCAPSGGFVERRAISGGFVIADSSRISARVGHYRFRSDSEARVQIAQS